MKKVKGKSSISPQDITWHERLRRLFAKHGFIHTASAFQDDCLEVSFSIQFSSCSRGDMSFPNTTPRELEMNMAAVSAKI